MSAKKKKKKYSVTRGQLARVLFRTMSIEEPGATRSAAKRAAAKIRLPR